ncbi:MAG: hypothetical protein K2G70_02600 [Turicibacter sp.]|nr:hypothetical protein [Turicibacter sp.]
MFAQGRLWYDGSTVRSGGSPKFRELLVTRQPLQFANHNARPVLADVEGRRIPLFDKQLTPQNTSAYRWEDGYGYRRVLPPEDRQRARFIFSERPSTLT